MLRPGIALTVEQVKALTSDIVWLVEQTVTLPDGTSTRALVPQVYVANIRPGDIDGSGVLLSARGLNINVTGDVNNSGTIGGNINGRSLVSINAANINNLLCNIQGEQVSLNASQDITNTGGTLAAASALQLNAGRDINLTSTTASNKDAGGAFTRTQVDRLAGVYVAGLNGAPGSLNLTAGRDLKAQTAVVANTSTGGATSVQAGRDIALTTVTTDQSIATGGGANFFRSQTSQDVGSSITSQGNLTVSAGNNINATAANLQSSQADTSLTAGNTITLAAGQRTSDMAWGSQSTSGGLLSSSRTTRRETGSTSQAIGSQVGGNTVNITAAQDINIQGSSVIAEQAASLSSGNKVNLQAAHNTASQSSFIETKSSGLLSGGGLGITIGTRQQSTDEKSQSSTAAASTVGSIKGNVTATAGKDYRQVGSDVMAPGGNVSIQAQTVTIQEARETSQSATEQQFKQSGISIGISNPLISAAQTAQSLGQAASNTSDPRMQALAGAAAALNGYNTYKSLTDKAGNFSPEKAKDISVNISIGSSKSQSNSN